MTSQDQLSLFHDSTVDSVVPAAVSQPELIPTDAKIPIPPGTYSTVTQLAQHCNQCHRCGLGDNRTHAVVGRGNLQAPIMIVGEAPGQNEDETGLPFVGKSGQLLEKILASVKLDTEKDLLVRVLTKAFTSQTTNKYGFLEERNQPKYVYVFCITQFRSTFSMKIK